MPSPHSRVRSQSSRFVFHQGYEAVYNSSGQFAYYSADYGNYAGYGSRSDMTDVVGNAPVKGAGASGYRENAVSLTRKIFGGTPVVYNLQQTGGSSYRSTGNCTPALLSVLNCPVPDEVDHMIDASTTQAVVDSAVTKCLAGRAKGNVNMFENLGQISKTLDELRHPFRNFALWSDRWVSRYEARARKVRGSRKTQVKVGTDIPLDTYAAAWLQYRYGVRLLIKDVEEVLKQLKEVKERRQIITTRGIASISDSSSVNNGTFLAGVGKWSSSYIKDETLSVRATSHDEQVFDVLDALGLSGKNLLTVGWELLPYSFVADWFMNIGDFLAASIPTPGLAHVSGCVSVKRTTSVRSTITPGGINGVWVMSGATGTHNLTVVEYARFPGIGSPTLQFNPDFGLLKPTRAADAVALAFGALQRAFGASGRVKLLTRA